MNDYWPRPGSMAEQAIERLAVIGGRVPSKRIVEGIDGTLTTRGLRSCLGPCVEHGIVGCAQVGTEFEYWLIDQEPKSSDELRKVGPAWCWVPASAETQPPADPHQAAPSDPPNPGVAQPPRYPRPVSLGRDGRLTIRSYGTTTVLDRNMTREVYDYVLDSVARDAP